MTGRTASDVPSQHRGRMGEQLQDHRTMTAAWPGMREWESDTGDRFDK